MISPRYPASTVPGAQGTFTGAGGQVGTVPLLMSAGEGKWRFDGRRLVLDGAIDPDRPGIRQIRHAEGFVVQADHLLHFVHGTLKLVDVLADVATGYPVLVSEMTLLTALRTAATSAVSLASASNPRVM